jgi:hypothetical protein
VPQDRGTHPPGRWEMLLANGKQVIEVGQWSGNECSTGCLNLQEPQASFKHQFSKWGSQATVISPSSGNLLEVQILRPCTDTALYFSSPKTAKDWEPLIGFNPFILKMSQQGPRGVMAGPTHAASEWRVEVELPIPTASLPRTPYFSQHMRPTLELTGLRLGVHWNHTGSC